MATISASTTHKMTVKSKKVGTSRKQGGIGTGIGKGGAKGGKSRAAVARRGSVAPPLNPLSLSKPTAITRLKEFDEEARRERVMDLLRRALGEQSLLADRGKPHTASTTRSRSGAAADVGVAARELGLGFVLYKCQVLVTLQQMLFPDGLASLQIAAGASSMTQASSTAAETNTIASSNGLRPSASAVSLASLDDTTITSEISGGTDTKRGKSTPPNAREGSLLVIRALCQFLGRQAEPIVVSGFLAAALDECASSSSSVREAAEDAASAIVALANPWAFSSLIFPILIQAIKSTEWRVKFNALERLAQCATTSSNQVNSLLPRLIPQVTAQIFDTKPQVTKAAASTLLAICQTCQNPDVSPAIPSVVQAICKPADTTKAVQELMSTTFVVPVDASTLAILCPVLARALKEKLAIHKRAACLVISNMSRLVEDASAVAPFGPLLVPELQKVANNVQFEEIRDGALKALENLTKALGDYFQAAAASGEESTLEQQQQQDRQKQRELENNAAAQQRALEMEAETARIKAEQVKIQQEREAEAKRQEEIALKEQEERRRFKEAMDAQRQLSKLEDEKAKEKRIEDMKKKDKEKRSTKGAGGKCQSCGLKKCKKSCLFYGQK